MSCSPSEVLLSAGPWLSLLMAGCSEHYLSELTLSSVSPAESEHDWWSDVPDWSNCFSPPPPRPSSRLRPLEANLLEFSLHEQCPPATPHVQCALSHLSSQDLQSIPSMGRSKLSSGFSGKRRVEVLLPCDFSARRHMDSKQVNQPTGSVDAESEVLQRNQAEEMTEGPRAVRRDNWIRTSGRASWRR